MRRFLLIPFLFLLCTGFVTATPPRISHRKMPGVSHSATGRATSESLKVGSLTLRSCKAGLAYCGSIQRALDPSGQFPREIKISFEFYPHTDNSQSPLEPIVATEGGPGYATTGTAPYYLDLFAPLRDRRDMLFVDNRGTGKSQALLCPSRKSRTLVPMVCMTVGGNLAMLPISTAVASRRTILLAFWMPSTFRSSTCMAILTVHGSAKHSPAGTPSGCGR